MTAAWQRRRSHGRPRPSRIGNYKSHPAKIDEASLVFPSRGSIGMVFSTYDGRVPAITGGASFVGDTHRPSCGAEARPRCQGKENWRRYNALVCVPASP